MLRRGGVRRELCDRTECFVEGGEEGLVHESGILRRGVRGELPERTYCVAMVSDRGVVREKFICLDGGRRELLSCAVVDLGAKVLLSRT